MAPLTRGVYEIHNPRAGLAIDLAHGSSSDGTEITGWEFTNTLNWNQLWLVEPVSGQANTFTLCNLRGGTYMDLSGGNSGDKTPIIGWHNNGGKNQQWIIKESINGGTYKMQNVMGGTFVDLYNGGSRSGTPIYGWQGSFTDDNPHQLWHFESKSLPGTEIKKLVDKNPHLHGNYRGYLLDGEYLILPDQVWQDIFKTTILNQWKDRNFRSQIFDSDDFSHIMKSAIGQWGADNFKADNFAVFCGLMFGESKATPTIRRAYNFNVNADKTEIIFFDARRAEFKEDIGFDAVLAYY